MVCLLFVHIVEGQVRHSLNRQDMTTVCAVRTIRTDREAISRSVTDREANFYRVI